MPVDDLEGNAAGSGCDSSHRLRLKGGTLSLELVAVGPLDKLVSTGRIQDE